MRRLLDLDKTDIAILRCLDQDCRVSLRTIAKKVGVSVPTVSARLATLEQLGIVHGYRAVLSPDRLNETSVILAVHARLQATEDIAKSLTRHDWARRVLATRNGWILIDVTVVDRAEVDSILGEIAALPDVIDCEQYAGLRTLKDEPRALITDSLSTNLICFQCRGPIEGEPIKLRLDERDHYLCCHSCEKLYLERYRKLKAEA